MTKLLLNVFIGFNIIFHVTALNANIFHVNKFYAYNTDTTKTKWQSRLYTPTHAVKINNNYFIVDCWHHRIIYSENLRHPIKKWSILDDNLCGPHSIATNGELLVVDNTGDGSIHVYKEIKGNFDLIQKIEHVGGRPHRVVYCDETKAFFVINSTSFEIVKLIQNGRQLEVAYIKKLDFIKDKYTRSISIINQKMYFLTFGEIVETNYLDDSYEVHNRFKVPPGFEGTNDLFFDGSNYFLTSTPKKMLAFSNFEELEHGKFIDCYSKLGLQGTPYYITIIGNSIIIPTLDNSAVVRFDLNVWNKINLEGEGSIMGENIFNFGEPNQNSVSRKSLKPT